MEQMLGRLAATVMLIKLWLHPLRNQSRIIPYDANMIALHSDVDATQAALSGSAFRKRPRLDDASELS